MASVLPENDWQRRRHTHELRVRAWTDAHHQRAARGEKHPVYDFLFDYYAYRPAWLKRWHPGIGVSIEGDAAREFLRWREYEEYSGKVQVQPSQMSPGRRDSVHWIRNLLVQMTARPPFFGCFGLHEWAMVYRMRPDDVRHADWPLRLGIEGTARVVEEQTVCCTHFDAFRFFTAAARPFNRHQPERASIPDLEQRGCLHANMDLYKWAFKLAPFSPSELVADCFELARDIREIDMRASPYDLTRLGFDPVCIETSSGRAEYENRQRAFSARGVPLREQLIAVCDSILADFAEPSAASSTGEPGRGE